MNKMNDEKLDSTIGGNVTMNGPIIHAIVDVINLLREAGYSVGSGIRRICEKKICPLD